MSEPRAKLDFLFNGPATAPLTLVLAHGAEAPMDTNFMDAFAEGLVVQSHGRWRVARFEFPYMAARRKDGRERPPDPEPELLETWRSAIAELGPRRLVVGGKSLGGLMASMIAEESGVLGLVCLGYPFHPQGAPERLRVDHLVAMKTPMLIVQGTRDPFGDEDEVPSHLLSSAIKLHWIEGADHDLAPHKSTGRNVTRTWTEAISAVGDFLGSLQSAQ